MNVPDLTFHCTRLNLREVDNRHCLDRQRTQNKENYFYGERLPVNQDQCRDCPQGKEEARKAGITIPTVGTKHQIRRSAGNAPRNVDRFMREHGFTDERTCIEAVYHRCNNVTATAKALGCSTLTLLDRMNYLGIEKRKRGGQKRRTSCEHYDYGKCL